MKFIHAMLHCLVIHKVQKDKTLVAPQCRGQDMNDENLMKIVVNPTMTSSLSSSWTEALCLHDAALALFQKGKLDR